MAEMLGSHKSRVRKKLGVEAEHIQRAKRDVAQRSGWHTMAFQLESIVLLAFIILSITLITVLFAASYQKGTEANRISESLALAVSSAENSAETFAADPINSKSYTTYYLFEDGKFIEVDEEGEGIYAVSRVCTPEKREAGTLYRATVTVECNGLEVYSLNTAKYVSERG